MNCFVIIHSGTERQKIIDLIDKIPEIVNWRGVSGAIFVASDKNENWISERIHAGFPELTYLVAQIKIDDSQGYLDKETWDFIRKPRRAGT
jgi:hypothetical protein